MVTKINFYNNVERNISCENETFNISKGQSACREWVAVFLIYLKGIISHGIPP